MLNLSTPKGGDLRCANLSTPYLIIWGGLTLKNNIMDLQLGSLMPKGASTSLQPKLADLSSKAQELASSGSLSKALSASGAGLGIASGVYSLADTFLNSENAAMPAGLTSQEKQQISSQRRSNANKTARSSVSGIMSILGSVLALAAL